MNNWNILVAQHMNPVMQCLYYLSCLLTWKWYNKPSSSSSITTIEMFRNPPSILRIDEVFMQLITKYPINWLGFILENKISGCKKVVTPF